MAEIRKAATHDTTLFAELVVAGKRVYIRTPRQLRAPRELRESPDEKGADPPPLELSTVAPEAEP